MNKKGKREDNIVSCETLALLYFMLEYWSLVRLCSSKGLCEHIQDFSFWTHINSSFLLEYIRA